MRIIIFHLVVLKHIFQKLNSSVVTVSLYATFGYTASKLIRHMSNQLQTFFRTGSCGDASFWITGARNFRNSSSRTSSVAAEPIRRNTRSTNTENINKPWPLCFMLHKSQQSSPKYISTSKFYMMKSEPFLYTPMILVIIVIHLLAQPSHASKYLSVSRHVC